MMSTLSFIERETIYRLFGIQEGFLFVWWARQGKYNKNKTNLFFIETLGYFLNVHVNIHGTWPDIRKHTIYTWRTSDEEVLTDIGIVAYKIMLAVHIAHETIGVHDFQIEDIQKWIDKSHP